MIAKTKIKKALIWASVSALIALPAFAAPSQIGTWSVTWSWAFNSAIMWDWEFPWTASGTVSWIVVTATVTPTLNMSISSWSIDLWALNSSTYSTWSIGMEIWTNAVGWVVVTAKSNSWWLTNTANWSIQINNLVADWIGESYKFTSTLSWALDSTVVWYTRASSLSTEIADTTAQTIYTTNKPEQATWVDDVKFDVSAKIDPQTPAWSYRDTINFTVSWTF